MTCSCGGGAAAHSPKNVAPCDDDHDHHHDDNDDNDDNDDDDDYDNGKLRHTCSEGSTERGNIFLDRISEIGQQVFG